MKAIAIHQSLATARLYADSAIGRDAMPLFLPADGACTVSVCLALRVGRLGKNVAPKFAHRYIDAVSLVALLQPQGIDSALGFMDSAVTAGAWLPIAEESTLEIGVSIEPLRSDGAATSIAQLAVPMQQAMEWGAQALAQITTVATVKTGDIIIAAVPIATFEPQPDTRLRASIGGQQCLSLKLK